MKLSSTFKTIVILFILMTGQIFAQVPANDNCTGAINIPIGTPPACGSGTQTGSSGSVTGNITNATPGNPYTYQSGCTGSSATQAFPANDVWYKFTATGYNANITINSTFANPNIAFYSGTCASLGGGIGGCTVGSGGTANLTVTQLVPGTTYYIQVSGNTAQTGTFTLSINNSISCSACLVNSSITVTPPPVNGAYPPGTSVQICFHVGQFNTTNTNWFHGVQLSLGSCWDKPTLTTNVPNAAGTSGTWAYYPTGIGIANSVNWGPGWYFDYSPSDGNPKNNFGDLPSGPVLASEWNFCATVKTSPVCNPGCDLSVTFNTSGDGESGSWSSSGCSNDQPAIFKAIGACCPPVMSMVPVKCFSTSTGTVIATPVGTVSPYTYNWSGPSGYSSSTSSVTGSSTISNVPSGIYTVQVIDKNLCSTTNTILVTQPTSITATPSFTNATCLVLGSASVSVSGGSPGYTYTWSPSGGNSASATGLSPGTYTVSIQDSKLCLKTATVTIAQTGSVSAAFSTPTPTQCLTGNSYVFTASVSTGTHTYSFNPTVGAPPTGNSATYGPVSFTAPGTYTVIHTITSGVCTNTTTSLIVIKPQPTVTANNNSPACVGGSVVFAGTGGGTYSWSGPAGFTSALQNPTLSPISLSNAGVYTLTVNLNGCIETATTNVSISNPTTSASNTGPFCVGTTIQLNSPAATSYTWSGPGGFTSNLQNPTIANATAAMGGVYTLTVSLGVCTATAATTVVINPLPVLTPTNTGPYCPGNTIQLNVGAFTTYTWSGPSAFSSNSQNPTQANAQTTNGGVYTVSVTNANGCVNSATTNVVVNPSPTVVIGSNSPVCLNSPINLTSSGGTGYSWSGPNSFSSLTQNPTIGSATSANAGVYTVTVTSLGCTNTGTVSVTVLAPTTTASNTGPFCAGTTIQLNTPAANTYTWTGPGGFTSGSQNPTIANATAGMAGTYSVLVSVGSCTAFATTTVVINPLPVPVAANTGPYCPGNTIQLNVGTFTTYTWTGPSAFGSNLQNPTQSNAQTTNGGVYTVSVSDVNGCVNTSTTNVVVNPTPSVVIGSNSPVCISTAINLTSGGGTGYSWSGPNSFSSSSQNPTIGNATAANAGVYTVTVTALGCTNTGTVSVTVLSPTTSASNPGPFCAGTTIQLNTPTANTYTWSGPAGFSSNAQNPTIANANTGMSGVYSVTAAVGSCTAAATTSVTVNALPVPAATNTGPYCPGNTIQLNVGAFTTYTWSGPSSFNSNIQNATQPNAQTTNSGIYTVTVQDASGCMNTSTTNVVVNPTPVVVIGSNSPVCINTNINLNANGGTSYSWSGPNSFSSVSQNPTIPNATSLEAGVYNVTVTAFGCTNTGSVSVNVLNPTTTASNTGAYCAGAVIQLSTPAANSYTWNGPGGYVSNTQNPSLPGSNTSMSGVYNVTVTVGTCTAAATTSVTVNALPAPNPSNTGPYCSGTAIQLNVGPFNTYSWTGPGAFSDNTQNPTIPNSTVSNGGVYVVTVTDANGCVNTSSTTVVVNATPIAAASGATVCENTTANLTANGGQTYAWSGPGGFISAVQNPSLFNSSLSASGQYTVVVMSSGSCTDVAVANVLINPAPVPNIVTNSPICINNVLTLSASGGNTYAWTGPNGFVSSVANPTLFASSVAFSGNYQVTVTGAGGCTASTSTNVVVNPNLVPSISSGPNVGCAPLCVNFTVSSTPPTANASWLFGNGSTTVGISATSCFNSAGIYTVTSTATDANGCTGIATYTVEVYPQPVADFNHAPIKPVVNVDGEVTFTDASWGTPVVSWNWYFMNTAQYTSVLQNPTFMYTEAGTYAVALVVKSDKGCLDTLVRPLVVGEDYGLYVPNAFTPNQDGLNDLFQPKGFGIVKYELNIFDRWGERTFHTEKFEEGWSGTFQGRGTTICEEGVYTWLINVTDVFGKAHELKGHVTLIK
jgi:gliding motility-associated-like protein